MRLRGRGRHRRWCYCAVAVMVGVLWGASCGRVTPVSGPTAATATAPDAPTITSTLTTLSPTPTVTATRAPTSTPTPTATPRPTAVPLEALAAEYPELAPVLDHPEISVVYKELAVAYEQGGQERVMALARERGLLTSEGDIRVVLVLDTDDPAATVTQLEAMGIQVVDVDPEGRWIQMAVPQGLLMAGANRPGPAFVQLSNLEHVVSVRSP